VALTWVGKAWLVIATMPILNLSLLTSLKFLPAPSHTFIAVAAGLLIQSQLLKSISRALIIKVMTFSIA
jgi:hypothetical protein